MRLDTPYDNPNLEAKRLAHLRTLNADDALRREKARRADRRRDAAKKAVTAGVARVDRDAARSLARAVAGTKLVDPAYPALAAGVRALASWHGRWLRDPADWRPRSHNAARQFASLLRHALAAYDVPAWFDAAFTDGDRPAQAWFAHVAAGGNLRSAPGRVGRRRGSARSGAGRRSSPARPRPSRGRCGPAAEVEASWASAVSWLGRDRESIWKARVWTPRRPGLPA